MLVSDDSSIKKFQLRKTLKFLASKKGFHTELITLMIPPGRKLSDITNYLKSEINESSNIKSKLTRKNVIDSITALLQKLRTIRQDDLPETGLMLFSGAIPQGNSAGTEKTELYVIEPLEPLTTFKYYCSSEFLLEPLERMLTDKRTYGVVVIDRKELAIGWVRGSHVVTVKTKSSGVANRHHAGGQSQRRFERLHDEHVNVFLTDASESMNEIFVPMAEDGFLEGIFIGGAGHTKIKLVDKGLLDHRIRDKIIELYDIGVSGEAGIRAILMKAEDKIANVKYIIEKKFIEKLMYNISRDTGLAAYGTKEVISALNAGAVQTLLVSEGLDDSKITVKCEQCEYTSYEFVKQKKLDATLSKLDKLSCPKCNSTRFSVSEIKEIIEELGEIAESLGTKIAMVSTETDEGETLKSTFGGIAAILRYRIM